MAHRLILVNGLPGSGKSTLAGRLAPALRVPLIGKDALKEAMAKAAPGVPPDAFGPVAAAVMWELAAATPGVVILESWWFRPRDLEFVTEGITHCGAVSVVEIWCSVPPELALARRPQLYDQPQWMAEAGPLGVGPVIHVDNDRPVIATALIEAISQSIGGV
ncbi:AAA family ATPase [Actinoplanes sp. G11-F43]|uniref:AAA family ATPase n=1 Tax=Actinoplanes sp. G11-F43 TaxID=3424130 RepID=UPI003D34BB14